MGMMSRQTNLPQIQRILQEFEKESAVMDMKEEMMGDAIDDAMEDEDTEEAEGDKILDEVLAEIGISVGQQLGEVPTMSPTAAVAEPQRQAVAEGGAGDSGVDSLQARLDQLRKD